MISLYYFFFSLALALVGPYLLLSKRTRPGLLQKLGIVPAAITQHLAQIPSSAPRVWFHAVSVGEFNALWPLVEKFRKEHPEFEIFISTTTATGQELACSRASQFACVFYFPLDFPWAVSKFLDLIRPSLVAIVETEIWPGFMHECRKRSINVALVNGRLSPRSFKGYLRWKWFFAPVVAQFNAIGVQSEDEFERFASLAGTNLPMQICGNIKLDGLKAGNAAEIVQIRSKLNLKETDLVVVAGSTHEGEESALLEALKQLNCRFRLIIAPRHPERFERVQQLIENSGFKTRFFSRQEGFTAQQDVFLLDTIGQLSKYYGVADIAFVGGTLADIGGHNLAEPCAYKAPVVCGPHIHKTRDLFVKLVEREALLMVHHEKELISVLQMLLDSPSKRQQLGENGFRFLEESQGALAKTSAMLEEYLYSRDAGKQLTVGTVGGLRR